MTDPNKIAAAVVEAWESSPDYPHARNALLGLIADAVAREQADLSGATKTIGTLTADLNAENRESCALRQELAEREKTISEIAEATKPDNGIPDVEARRFVHGWASTRQ